MDKKIADLVEEMKKMEFMKNSDFTDMKSKLEKEMEIMKQKYEKQLSELKDEMAAVKKASSSSLDLERSNSAKAIKDLEAQIADQLKRLQEKAENVRELEKKNQEQNRDLTDERQKLAKLIEDHKKVNADKDQLQKELESCKRHIGDLETDVQTR